MSGAGVVAIVLAAGGSSRMGTPKMLARLDGRPLVCGATETALVSRVDDVIVVVGANAAEVRGVLEGTPARFVDNPDWSTGLAGSIRCGVETAREADAVLLILADQPALTPGILDALVEAHRAGRTQAACQYEDGTIGPPALLGRAHFAALQSLEGDQGARALLRAGNPVLVPFPGGTLDVDTPEDLARAREAGGR